MPDMQPTAKLLAPVKPPRISPKQRRRLDAVPERADGVRRPRVRSRRFGGLERLVKAASHDEYLVELKHAKSWADTTIREMSQVHGWVGSNTRTLIDGAACLIAAAQRWQIRAAGERDFEAALKMDRLAGQLRGRAVQHISAARELADGEARALNRSGGDGESLANALSAGSVPTSGESEDDE